jgi:crotonobetainyl-CoA:carnitine CoA-transferase CaiB-like acyl-CoA transferase
MARDQSSYGIFIGTFRPNMADRHVPGYEALPALNYRFIYASITVFWRKGRWARIKDYEGVAAALLGISGSFSATPTRRRKARLRRPPKKFD